jgi:hypothetical protein
MLQSIISYPDRGKWGNSRYRGNCSGWLIKELLTHFQPKKFIEIFAGGGTGFDVAKDLGYTNSVHLDLNPAFGGWNALADDIPEGGDFVFLHPPYHNIIKYSGEVWGEPHPDDLSRCADYQDFLKKLNLVFQKVYTSIRHGGRYAVLIGDVRSKGEYYSIQRDMAWIGKLESHIIKAQHNCLSDRKTYSGKFIPIVHEHLLVFRKNDIWIVPVSITKTIEQDLRQTEKITWRDLVQAAMEQLGGKASLNDLYNIIGKTKKAANNPHWKEKVRQVLQLHKEFISVGQGCWEIAA